MNNLEDIGFYTLSDKRARNTSTRSPLWRCELLLTNCCNFKCTYCRGLAKHISQDLSIAEAKTILNLWYDDGLKNIRFSGGEPTLFGGLIALVAFCRCRGVERIAISTNGSAPRELYDGLIDSGVNDVSISLDACCAQMGDSISRTPGSWVRVIENIRYLSEKTYVTCGMVFTENNIDTCLDSVLFASSLGVADIRVIPSAQYNQALTKLCQLSDEILQKHPILSYRVNRLRNGEPIRGIARNNHNKCRLVLDDMAVVGGHHYPCIIYLREGGRPIGKVGPGMRGERLSWMQSHEPQGDSICQTMCLDVCVDYNKKAAEVK